MAFVFLVSYEIMVSVFVLGKALRCQTDDRRRSLMVFMFSIIMAVFIVFQVFWPLTPFTALGCLIGNCFFRVFVAQDEHATEQRNLLEKALERARAADLKSLPSRVLVVDDSPVNRLVLTSFLKKAGIGEIDQASDGEEALLALNYAAQEERPYDLVLSDCWMPNMDGFEFIEKAREDSRFERLSVFAVTADSECRSNERARLFTGILIKPMTYAKLLEVLDSLSQQRCCNVPNRSLTPVQVLHEVFFGHGTV